jgi:quinol monooxygenase YgiN
MSYILWARWHVAAGHDDEVERILLELGRRTGEEPGSIQWNAARSEQDPREFVFFEEYVDEEAFQAHAASAHVKELLPAAAAHLESRERGFYRPVGQSS